MEDFGNIFQANERILKDYEISDSEDEEGDLEDREEDE